MRTQEGSTASRCGAYSLERISEAEEMQHRRCNPTLSATRLRFRKDRDAFVAK
ncbi:hypothetical protein [Candidatus Odyssella acanthamoebae]|nr:hypothetical protein [Candidatus Paracaedibacter acanthamoebae]